MRVLFLCAVTFAYPIIIFFAFYLQGLSFKHTDGTRGSVLKIARQKTASTLEESGYYISELHLNLTTNPENQTFCPQGPIVSALDGGRLANKIWVYAATWSMARLLGRPGYVPQSMLTSISNIYANLSLHAIEDIEHCAIDLGEQINDTSLLMPFENVAETYAGKHILMRKCIQFPESVMLYKDILHEEFRVRPDLQKEVDDTVKRLGGEGHTKIGVHVRRTDYPKYMAKRHNMTSLSDSFFYTEAMQWYRENIKGPLIFLIVTDDVEWCEENLLDEEDVKIASKSASHDLALLASSDHTIVDYGTYGHWGSFMVARRGGHVISINVSKNMNTVMAQNFDKWHKIDLEDSKINVTKYLPLL